MTEDEKKQLGLKIKSLRENEKFTQEDLSEICDVSWRTISNLERGTVIPDLRVIFALAKHFNTSIDELLNFDTNSKKSQSRLEKENSLISKIGKINDSTLNYIIEQIDITIKHYN